MTEYKINLEHLRENDSFPEASKEELRVLLALIALDGKYESADELALAAKTTRARAASALVFWQEANVINSGAESDNASHVFEEFLPRTDLDSHIEESRTEIAKHIRDKGLAGIIAECARLLEKPMLSTEETKKIVMLCTEYSLSEEYIVTLAAYLLSKEKLTVTRLVTDAQRLVKLGIDCNEELEKYLEEKEKETGADRELCKLIGIRGRFLSQMEKEYARRWIYDYGYSRAIIGLAYSKSTVATGNASLPYMDTLIKKWHEAGCKTLAECEAMLESDSKAISAEYEKKKEGGARSKKKPTPRYGEFDINDAFSKALSRSYGDEENGG